MTNLDSAYFNYLVKFYENCYFLDNPHGDIHSLARSIGTPSNIHVLFVALIVEIISWVLGSKW